jgi:uncharacterized surface protein with fasciclin (FAS1) repeats
MRLSQKIAGILAGTALVAGTAVAVAPTASATAAPSTGGQRIVQALLPGYQAAGDGNPYDFDIVTTAIIATGLLPTLQSLDNITVFAPNDRAFEVLAVKTGALPRNHRFGATVDETQIVNALVAKLGVDTIRKVVLYHVFTGGALAGADVVKLPVLGTRITMADGQKLGITNLTRIFGAPTIILGDKDGNPFNDYVVRSKVNVVKVQGGVVHGISDVLMPTL